MFKFLAMLFSAAYEFAAGLEWLGKSFNKACEAGHDGVNDWATSVKAERRATDKYLQPPADKAA